jgi:hypothetical protein
MEDSNWKNCGGTSAWEGVEARQLRRCMIEIEIEIARNVYMHNPSASSSKEAYYCMYRLLIEHVHGSVFANLLDGSEPRPTSQLACDRWVTGRRESSAKYSR